jgi:RNA polymerase sigma-70 factor (ECF subfamily)
MPRASERRLVKGAQRGSAEDFEAPFALHCSLPVDQRAVVVLRHGLGYTPGEIARMLELPRGTVNSRLRRALDRLEMLLEADRDGA